MARSLGEAILRITVKSDQAIKGIGNIGSKMQGLGRGMQSVGTKMAAAGAIITGTIGLIAKKSLVQFADVEQAMQEAFSIAGITKNTKEGRKAIAEITKDIEEIGKASKFTELDLAAAFRQIVSAGITAPKAIKGIIAEANDLALAMGTDIPDAVGKIISGINQMPSITKDKFDPKNIKAITNNLTDLQGASRIETEDLFFMQIQLAGVFTQMKGGQNEARDLMAAFGVLNTTLGNGARSATAMREALVNMERGLTGDDAAKAQAEARLKAIGLTLQDIRPSVVGTNKALENMAKSGITNLAKATNLLGTKGVLAMQILAKNFDDIAETRKRMDNMASAADRAAANMSTLRGSMDKFTSSISLMFKVVGKALSEGGFKKLLDQATDMLNKFIDWIAVNPKLVAQIVTIIGIIGVVLTILGTTILTVGLLLVAIGGIVSTITGAIAAAGGIIAALQIVGIAIAALPALFLILGAAIIASIAMFKTLKTNMARITALAKKLFTKVKPIFEFIKEFILNKLIPTIKKLMDVATVFYAAFIDGFLTVMEKVEPVFDFLIEAYLELLKALEGLFDSVTELLGLSGNAEGAMTTAAVLGEILGFIFGALVTIFVAVAGAIITIVGWFVKLIAVIVDVITWIKNLVEDVGGFVEDIFPIITAFLGHLPGIITGGLKKLFNIIGTLFSGFMIQVTTWGANLMTSFWDGLKTVFIKVWTWLKDKFNKAKELGKDIIRKLPFGEKLIGKKATGGRVFTGGGAANLISTASVGVGGKMRATTSDNVNAALAQQGPATTTISNETKNDIKIEIKTELEMDKFEDALRKSLEKTSSENDGGI